MILLTILLLVKHVFGDKFFQPSWISLGKRASGTKGVKNLAVHAGIHGALTFVVVAAAGFLTINPFLISVSVLVGLVDFVLHFCIDKFKVVIESYCKIQYGTKAYYLLLLLDQGLHALSYVGYILFLG